MPAATKSRTRTFSTAIDIPAEKRDQVNGILNQNLANSLDLFSQVKQAHWNVKGNDFWQLHKLFDEVAEAVEEWTDMIAERVGALGGYANGTARMAASSSDLPEFPTDITEGMQYVSAVTDRLGQYSNAAREAIDQTDKLGDLVTSDLFTEISRDADKYIYFLQAHLQE